MLIGLLTAFGCSSSDGADTPAADTQIADTGSADAHSPSDTASSTDTSAPGCAVLPGTTELGSNVQTKTEGAAFELIPAGSELPIVYGPQFAYMHVGAFRTDQIPECRSEVDVKVAIAGPAGESWCQLWLKNQPLIAAGDKRVALNLYCEMEAADTEWHGKEATLTVTFLWDGQEHATSQSVTLMADNTPPWERLGGVGAAPPDGETNGATLAGTVENGILTPLQEGSTLLCSGSDDTGWSANLGLKLPEKLPDGSLVIPFVRLDVGDQPLAQALLGQAAPTASGDLVPMDIMWSAAKDSWDGKMAKLSLGLETVDGTRYEATVNVVLKAP